jgi:hypothetical protein
LVSVTFRALLRVGFVVAEPHSGVLPHHGRRGLANWYVSLATCKDVRTLLYMKDSQVSIKRGMSAGNWELLLIIVHAR